MSADRYVIEDQHAMYFLTFTIVEWIDVFTRPDYKTIIVDSLNHCIDSKATQCIAWVIMTNHVHIILQSEPPFRLSDVIRDFKKYTSKKLVETILAIPESRRDWLLHKFSYNAEMTKRAEQYKVWRDGYHGICLDQHRLRERIEYIHQNPVRQQIASQPEHYLYSSAYDYAGGKGLVNVTLGL